MADNVSTILDVKLDAGKVAEDLQDLVTKIAALKQQQRELNAEIKAGNDVDGKYAEQLIRVKDQLSWTEKQAKGLSATTKLLNADTLTYSDSLNGQRQKLADMQKAYDQLDKAARESEGGKAFLASIKEQSDAVKGMEESTGRAQRNVGNYSKSIIDAIPIGGKFGGMLKQTAAGAVESGAGFKGLANGIKLAMTAGLKFIATPIGLILAAIALAVGALVKAFQKVTEAFKKNDDAMTAVTKAFAIFKPIGEAVNAVFNSIANALAKVATGMANAVSWIVGKLAPGYAAAAEKAQGLVQAQDDLEEAERQYTVNSAKRDAEVAELRAKAAEATKYSAEERKKMLEQAIELEKQNLADQKAIAAERLRLLEAEAKQNRDTSDEMKNRIAEARAAMYNADQNYFAGVRRLNSQLTTFDKEEQAKRTENAKKALAKRAEAKKKAEQEEEARIKNAQEIAQMAEDFALSLIEDETTRKIAAYQIEGKREIEALKERLVTEKNLTEESREQLAQLIKSKTKKLNDDLAEMAAQAVEESAGAEYEKEYNKRRNINELRLEIVKEGSREEVELRLQQLDLQLEQELANSELSEEEKQLIREKYQQKRIEVENAFFELQRQNEADTLQDRLAAVEQWADRIMSVFTSITDAINAAEDAELERYKRANDEKQKALEKRLKAGLLSQEQYDREVAAMEAEEARRSDEIAIKQAKREKAAGIIQATIDTALAVARAFADYPWMVALPISLLAAAAGAAQIATIAKQPLPEPQSYDAGNFATGGVIGGNSYTGDKLIAHVNSGEGIYTGAQANSLLQQIANNPLRSGFDMDAYAQATAAAVAALPSPTVVYSELQEFGQRVTTYDEIARL